MFKSTMHVFAILFITATLAKAAVPRAIDADVIKSSDHTKTWVMPGVSGTFANTSDITSAVNAHEADTTNVHGIADTSLLLTTSTGLQKSNNLSDVSNAGTSRTNLGLGTMATQNSNGVSITGGTITTVDHDGGTASNTSRITLPKDTTTNLSSLTRKQGTLVYDTTLNKPVYDNGSNLITVGSGVGSSINYITNGGGEQDTSGWAAYSDAQTATITIASPGVITVGSTTGMSVGDRVVFTTSSALPTGLTASTIYYISSVVSSTTLKVSATLGGSDVNTSGTQSGTHTLRPLKPIDGTGGSPALSINRTIGVGAALRDDDNDGVTASLYVDKGVITDVAGEGVSYNFTLAKADYSPSPKMQTIAFDYYGQSNFVYGSLTTDSDLEVWIYARDTGVLIQPALFKLDGSGKFVAQFQPLTTDSNYRLILHDAQTHSNAWSWYFDSVAVGPQNIARGPPMSDWIDFPSVAAGTLITATTSSPTFGTTAVNKAQYRRVGSELEIEWDFRQTTNGTAGTGMYLFNIPAASGCTIDTSKKAVNTGTAINASFMDSSVGDLNVHYPGGSFRSTMTAVPYSTTQLKFIQMAVANGGVPAVATWSSAASTWLDAVTAISLHAKVPCSGWSSNTQNVIDEGRDVEAEYNGNGGTAITANVTDITFSTKVKDSHSAWSGTAYTAPLDGEYEVSGAVLYNAGVAGAVIDLYVNGVAKARVGGNTGATTSSYPFSGKLFLSKGDSLTVRSNTSGTLSSSTSAHRIVISRSSGRGSLTQPTETVRARYTTTAGQTITSGAAPAIIDFGTKDYDSHGGVTTGASWKFTAQIAGLYSVKSSIYFASSAAWGAGEASVLYLYKNGALYDYLSILWAQTAITMSAWDSGTSEVYLNAGDYIDVRLDQNSGSSIALQAGAGLNRIEINKVGN